MRAEVLSDDHAGTRARVRMTDAEGWLVCYQRSALDGGWRLVGVQMDGDCGPRGGEAEIRHVGVTAHMQDRTDEAGTFRFGLKAHVRQMLDAELRSYLERRRDERDGLAA